MEQKKDWLQIKKGVSQSSILSVCIFNFDAEYIMLKARLDKAQVGINIGGINKKKKKKTSDMKMTPPLSQKAKN